MKLVIDVSTYQDVYTFDKLSQLPANAVIIRAGAAHAEDDMLKTFVIWCRLLGLPFGFYFYFYPGLAIKAQCELFVALVNEYPDCTCVWVDIEEVKNFTTGNVINPDTLNSFYRAVFEYMRDALPSKVVGNYSGGWVLDTYIPKAWQWINSAPYWSAYYVTPFSWYKIYIASLGAVWDKEKPSIPLSNMRGIMEEVNKHWPPNPLGVTKVRMWQALTWLPYLDTLTYWQKHIDVNIINDENDWQYLFNKQLDQGEIVNTNATIMTVLNVRSSPVVPAINWINRIGQFTKGERVEIESVTDGWGRVVYPKVGYVSMKSLTGDTVYVQMDEEEPLPNPVDIIQGQIDILETLIVKVNGMIEELRK